MAGTYVSVPGGHSFDLTVHGQGTVVSGSGNDRMEVGRRGHLTLGAGHDTLAPPQSGVIFQARVSGHDTIHIGSSGTVTTHSHALLKESAVIGKTTVVGAAAATAFVGGGSTSTMGSKGADTLVGGTGHDTLFGGKGADVLEFLNAHRGGTQLIQDFVPGHDKLYLEGQSLTSLKSGPDSSISSHGGNTYISLDGGKTTIELHGVTHLKTFDITPNKH